MVPACVGMLIMMRLIIGSSLRFVTSSSPLGAVLTWFGLARLRDVPVDVFPEFAPPRVEIQTICLGLSSPKSSNSSLCRWENALNGVPDNEVMRSKSVAQLSSILLIFKSPSTGSAHGSWSCERMALATKSLPTWAAPPFRCRRCPRPAGHEDRDYLKDKSVMDLSMLAYWTIRSATRCSRSCEHCDLGRAAQDASGHGRSEAFSHCGRYA